MKKISTVELLRFICAVMVMIWHYQHFYFPYNFLNTIGYPSIKIYQPFYDYLSFFYLYGRYGVDIFFLISGFVFSYVYLNSENILFRKFFLRRFARLYPLHIFTLILVVLFQYFSNENYGEYFIHQNNDLYHFFLNFFFISGWGFQNGPSFNGPIWSISIELIIYALFFFSIIKFKKNYLYNSISILVVFLLIYKLYPLDKLLFDNRIINCGILFYSGILTFYIFDNFSNFKIVIIATILMVIALIGNLKLYILIPSIVMYFICLEKYLTDSLRRIFNFLGNLTYAIYLLHIPFQIIIMILLFELNIDNEIFNSKLFFIFYVLSIFILSIIIYKYYEVKLRQLIRKYDQT